MDGPGLWRDAWLTGVLHIFVDHIEVEVWVEAGYRRVMSGVVSAGVCMMRLRVRRTPRGSLSLWSWSCLR